MVKNPYQEALDQVKLIISQRQKEDPEFDWEQLPWPIQYYPLFKRYYPHIRKISAVNPGISGYGGLIGASKYEILSKLAPSAVPLTLFIDKGTPYSEIEKAVRNSPLKFPDAPVICKPDVGERSSGVKKIHSFMELETFFSRVSQDYLIQEYVPGPEELAVSCFRNADTGKLEVLAIVRRIIPQTTGDGHATIKELVLAQQQLSSHEREAILASYSAERLETVPSEGERLLLSPVAALAYGTTIEVVDKEYYAEEFRKVEEYMQSIASAADGTLYEGFHYGRFDFRAESLEALFAGKAKVLELNGTAAMPLHACAPGLSLEARYSLFIQLFDLLLEIAERNHNQGTGTYTNPLKLWLYSRRNMQKSPVQRSVIKKAFKELRLAKKKLGSGGTTGSSRTSGSNRTTGSK